MLPRLDLPAIESLFRAGLRRPVEIVVVDNRSTVLRSIPRPGGRCTVRLHRIFLEAPPPVLEAAAGWLARGGRPRAAAVDRFVEERLPASLASRPPRAHAGGAVHDLASMLDRLSREHFGGKLDAAVAWGRPGRRRSPRSLKFGSFDPVSRAIRIHPALDRPFVPPGYVEFVLFHEMLHAALPPRRLPDGRRSHHHAEFRARERAFPGRERWQAWEKENLPRLLREARPGRRSASPPAASFAAPR